MPLDEKLRGILQRMIDAGESDENIQAVIKHHEQLNYPKPAPGPPEKVSKVSGGEPETFAGGVLKSLASGEAATAGLTGGLGFLKGAIANLPSTLYHMGVDAADVVTNPGQLLSAVDAYRYGVPEVVKMVKETTARAGSDPFAFGEMMGELTGQPLTGELAAAKLPAAAGKLAQLGGRTLQRARPSPGTPIAPTKVGLTRAATGKVGDVLENVGKRLEGTYQKPRKIDPKTGEIKPTFKEKYVDPTVRNINMRAARPSVDDPSQLHRLGQAPRWWQPTTGQPRVRPSNIRRPGQAAATSAAVVPPRSPIAPSILPEKGVHPGAGDFEVPTTPGTVSVAPQATPWSGRDISPRHQPSDIAPAYVPDEAGRFPQSGDLVAPPIETPAINVSPQRGLPGRRNEAVPYEYPPESPPYGEVEVPPVDLEQPIGVAPAPEGVPTRLQDRPLESTRAATPEEMIEAERAAEQAASHVEIEPPPGLKKAPLRGGRPAKSSQHRSMPLEPREEPLPYGEVPTPPIDLEQPIGVGPEPNVVPSRLQDRPLESVRPATAEEMVAAESGNQPKRPPPASTPTPTRGFSPSVDPAAGIPPDQLAALRGQAQSGNLEAALRKMAEKDAIPVETPNTVTDPTTGDVFDPTTGEVITEGTTPTTPPKGKRSRGGWRAEQGPGIADDAGRFASEVERTHPTDIDPNEFDIGPDEVPGREPTMEDQLPDDLREQIRQRDPGTADDAGIPSREPVTTPQEGNLEGHPNPIGFRVKNANGEDHGIITKIERSQGQDWAHILIPDQRVGYAGSVKKQPLWHLHQVTDEPAGWIPPQYRKKPSAFDTGTADDAGRYPFSATPEMAGKFADEVVPNRPLNEFQEDMLFTPDELRNPDIPEMVSPVENPYDARIAPGGGRMNEPLLPRSDIDPANFDFGPEEVPGPEPSIFDQLPDDMRESLRRGEPGTADDVVRPKFGQPRVERYDRNRASIPVEGEQMSTAQLQNRLNQLYAKSSRTPEELAEITQINNYLKTEGDILNMPDVPQSFFEDRLRVLENKSELTPMESSELLDILDRLGINRGDWEAEQIMAGMRREGRRQFSGEIPPDTASDTGVPKAAAGPKKHTFEVIDPNNKKMKDIVITREQIDALMADPEVIAERATRQDIIDLIRDQQIGEMLESAGYTADDLPRFKIQDTTPKLKKPGAPTPASTPKVETPTRTPAPRVAKPAESTDAEFAAQIEEFKKKQQTETPAEEPVTVKVETPAAKKGEAGKVDYELAWDRDEIDVIKKDFNSLANKTPEVPDTAFRELLPKRVQKLRLAVEGRKWKDVVSDLLSEAETQAAQRSIPFEKQLKIVELKLEFGWPLDEYEQLIFKKYGHAMNINPQSIGVNVAPQKTPSSIDPTRPREGPVSRPTPDEIAPGYVPKAPVERPSVQTAPPLLRSKNLPEEMRPKVDYETVETNLGRRRPKGSREYPVIKKK